MNITEYLLSIDEFQNPVVLKDSKAVMTLLVRLLLLEPGTIQSHPDAGVGLVSRYRYGMDGTAEELQSEFQKQIRLYLPPEFQAVRVYVKEKDKVLQITVEIDGNIFGISYDSDTSKIQATYSSISNL